MFCLGEGAEGRVGAELPARPGKKVQAGLPVPGSFSAVLAECRVTSLRRGRLGKPLFRVQLMEAHTAETPPARPLTWGVCAHSWALPWPQVTSQPSHPNTVPVRAPEELGVTALPILQGPNPCIQGHLIQGNPI